MANDNMAVEAPMTPEQLRNKARAAIFDSSVSKVKVEPLTFFGAEVELRQPMVGTFLNNVNIEDIDAPKQIRVVTILIENLYIPGTSERLFTDGDYDAVCALPFNQDMSNAISAINRLTGVDIKSAEKK